MELRYLLAIALLVVAATPGAAACHNQNFKGSTYTVCEFDARKDKIALFNLDGSGQPYGGFSPLRQDLAAKGNTLMFAMNGGMFGTDLRPIGLYVENGKMMHKASRAGGSGNFHLKPNGVFWVAGEKAGVTETEAYLKSGLKPDFATQSGPMLVVGGAIHPKLSPTGTSVKIRNGVGVVDDHTVEFVISDNLVTFHDFASLFLDILKCRNALFLDGSVSSLYAPELGRSDFLARLGPMVGVTAPAK